MRFCVKSISGQSIRNAPSLRELTAKEYNECHNPIPSTFSSQERKVADQVKQAFASTVKIIMNSLTGGWVGFATQSIEEALDIWNAASGEVGVLEPNEIIRKTAEALYAHSKNEDWSKDRSILLGQIAANRWKIYKPNYQEMAERNFDRKFITNRVIGDGHGLDVDDVEPIRKIIAISVDHILERTPPAQILAFMRESLRRSEELLQIVKRQSADSNQFEQKYRKAVATKLNTIEPYGVPEYLAPIRHHLTSTYIMLRGSCIVRSDQDSDLDITSGSLDEILPHGRRFLLEAEAGFGKTTLLRWLAIQTANMQFSGFLKTWNYLIPFYLQLRDFNKELPAPEDFPRLVAGSAIGLKPKDWVSRNLEIGSALLLVDGLDEVPASRRKKVHEWLDDLLLNFKNITIIITSRPAAVPRQWIQDMALINIKLEPMSIRDIEGLIRGWFTSIAESDPYYEDVGEWPKRLSEELIKFARRNRQIRNLMANPALCTLFCRLLLERDSTPSNYINLISEGLETLLGRRDITRGIEANFRYPSFYNNKLLLSQLAYWLIRNGQLSATTEEAKTALLPAVKRAHIDSSKASIDGLLRFLKERVGVLKEPQIGRIEFLYLDFQEFLAAEAIIEASDFNLALQNAHNSHWRGTIINVIRIVEPTTAENLILRIIGRSRLEKRNRRYLQLVALECLGQHYKSSKKLEDAAVELLRATTPPKNMIEANAFASAGDLAVMFLINQQGRNPDEVAACIRALDIIGTPMALEGINQYRSDTRPQVALELIRLAENTNSDDFTDDRLGSP